MRISPDYKEEDDDLHKPDPAPIPDGKWAIDHGGTVFTWRGVSNVGTLAVLIAAILTLL